MADTEKQITADQLVSDHFNGQKISVLNVASSEFGQHGGTVILNFRWGSPTLKDHTLPVNIDYAYVDKRPKILMGFEYPDGYVAPANKYILFYYTFHSLDKDPHEEDTLEEAISLGNGMGAMNYGSPDRVEFNGEVVHIFK